MKVEVPELRRCCFCIPLRHGLLFMAYGKMLVYLLQAVLMIININMIVRSSVAQEFVLEIAIAIGYTSCLLLDICFTLVVVVGGHLKNPRLLNIYLVYSVVMLCINILFFVWMTGQELYIVALIAQVLPGVQVMLYSLIRGKFLVGVIIFGCQIYMIILTRNEIDKLQKNSQYRFTNFTAEVQKITEDGPSTSQLHTGNASVGIQNGAMDRGSYNYDQF